MLPLSKKEEIIDYLKEFKKAILFLLKQNQTKEVQIKMAGYYFDQYIKSLSEEEQKEETIGDMLNLNKEGFEEFKDEMLNLLEIINKPFLINKKEVDSKMAFLKFVKNFEMEFLKDIEM